MNRTKLALFERGQGIHRAQFIGSGGFRIFLHQQRVNEIQYEKLRRFGANGVALQASLALAVNSVISRLYSMATRSYALGRR